MEKEIYLKCLDDDSMKEARLNIFRDINNTKIDFELDDLKFTKNADDYFAALIEIRKELEPKGIKLLCKGCSRNVYPSNMSIEMGGGWIAYEMKMGKEVEREDHVCIFDACTLEEYATIEEQLLFFEQWYENIKLVRCNGQK